ncbi:hypothetical protein IGI04_036439, partial [Brassica rapa subsp. trilocularis]
TGTASTTSVTTAPLSTIIPPPYCNNSHDPVTPSSTSAPPPIHSDDGHFDVAPENSGHVPTARYHERRTNTIRSIGACSKSFLVHSQIQNFWSSMGETTNLTKKNSLLKVSSSLNLPVKKLPPTKLKEDGSLHIP